MCVSESNCISSPSPGETNLDGLMTSLITSVEEHSTQVEMEKREEVSMEECMVDKVLKSGHPASRDTFICPMGVWIREVPLAGFLSLSLSLFPF